MKVSAVIPTIGRPELRRAVQSVSDQTLEVDAIVVLDRPDRTDDIRELLNGLKYELVTTIGATGGGAARNLGVERASGDYVAFLDDDDEWRPDKTAKQLAIAVDRPNAALVSRATLVGTHDRVLPDDPFSPDRSMVDYLIERSTVRLRKNFIQSSTLMLPTSLARSVPWRPGLPRHQDWTLLIELSERGSDILTHPEPLVRVYQDSVASISKSTNWRASEAWLSKYAGRASSRAKADFLCAVVLRSAISAGEWQEGWRILSRAVRLRPHGAALTVGLSALATRKPRTWAS